MQGLFRSATRAREHEPGLPARRVGEKVRREARVAELARVRPCVGQPEHGVLVGEELGDLALVEVQDGHAEACPKIAVQGQVEDEIYGVDAAL